jgi:hypothetical protein
MPGEQAESQAPRQNQREQFRLGNKMRFMFHPFLSLGSVRWMDTQEDISVLINPLLGEWDILTPHCSLWKRSTCCHECGCLGVSDFPKIIMWCLLLPPATNTALLPGHTAPSLTNRRLNWLEFKMSLAPCQGPQEYIINRKNTLTLNLSFTSPPNRGSYLTLYLLS